jgi:hypothetical protein
MMTSDDIELAFIREFSVAGNRIGRSGAKADRRERVRQAIYMGGYADDTFPLPIGGGKVNYSEAFRRCYGERLDRRAAMRSLPDEEPDESQGENEE